jgi:hypothetical protein
MFCCTELPPYRGVLDTEPTDAPTASDQRGSEVSSHWLPNSPVGASNAWMVVRSLP